MANADVSYALQDLGSGDTRALALKMFDGTVRAVYNANTPLLDMMQQKTITEGSSYQFPQIGRADVNEHNPGTDRTGNTKPITEERTVPVDLKEIESHKTVPKVDDNVRHFEVYGPYAMQMGAIIADMRESRAARQVCLGARRLATGPDNDFDSGILIQRDAATEAAAYPMSSLGSRNLQNDLGLAMQKLHERRITMERTGFQPTAFVSSRLGRVLTQDNGLTSADFVVNRETNSKIKAIVGEVEGWRIIITQNMPQHATAAGKPGYAINAGSGIVTSGEPAYQGNFSQTSWFGVGAADALGILNFGDMSVTPPDFDKRRRSTFVSAEHHGGIKWVGREACVEGYVSTSAYVEANGAAAPA